METKQYSQPAIKSLDMGLDGDIAMEKFSTPGDEGPFANEAEFDEDEGSDNIMGEYIEAEQNTGLPSLKTIWE